MEASVGRLAPTLATGKSSTMRARCHGPATPRRSSQALDRDGVATASSRSTETTVARARSRSASVSPSTRVKVPQDCSPAITSATLAGSSGVSIR